MGNAARKARKRAGERLVREERQPTQRYQSARDARKQRAAGERASAEAFAASAALGPALWRAYSAGALGARARRKEQPPS